MYTNALDDNIKNNSDLVEGHGSGFVHREYVCTSSVQAKTERLKQTVHPVRKAIQISAMEHEM